MGIVWPSNRQGGYKLALHDMPLHVKALAAVGTATVQLSSASADWPVMMRLGKVPGQ